jgi:hypothetical protein
LTHDECAGPRAGNVPDVTVMFNVRVRKLLRKGAKGKIVIRSFTSICPAITIPI